MSLLFSEVTLTADSGAETKFFVGGIPKDKEALKGWKKYENFVGELDSGIGINARVETYLYGGGEAEKAEPEEIAYLMKRIDGNPDFLSGHTHRVEDSGFRFFSPSPELFGFLKI